MKSKAAMLRAELRKRLASRPVVVPAKSLRNGEAISYVRLNGGMYVGFVAQVRPRVGEVRVVMWTKYVRHRDGTYGKGARAVVLRDDWIQESQITGRVV